MWGRVMVPHSAELDGGRGENTWGEPALRNVGKSRQPGLEALQREQDMPRGGSA